MTGHEIGTTRRFLPHMLRQDELARDIGVPLQQHRLVLNNTMAALDGVVIDRDMMKDDQILLLMVVSPINIQNTRLNPFFGNQCGQRRWYKADFI